MAGALVRFVGDYEALKLSANSFVEYLVKCYPVLTCYRLLGESNNLLKVLL